MIYDFIISLRTDYMVHNVFPRVDTFSNDFIHVNYRFNNEFPDFAAIIPRKYAIAHLDFYSHNNCGCLIQFTHKCRGPWYELNNATFRYDLRIWVIHVYNSNDYSGDSVFEQMCGTNYSLIRDYGNAMHWTLEAKDEKIHQRYKDI